jgi:hypothetical protein
MNEALRVVVGRHDYNVQFTGLPLAVGEPLTVPKDGERDEYQMFVSGSSQFPSNIIEFEVKPSNN